MARQQSEEAHTFLTPKQLSERWSESVTPDTLNNWRAQKKGPPWRKIGKKVVYRLDEVIRYEDERTVGGTA